MRATHLVSHVRQAKAARLNLIFVKVFVAQQFHLLFKRLLFEIALVALHLGNEDLRTVMIYRHDVIQQVPFLCRRISYP